jgi:KaiC/GvpD/RAD55 family RecA-like ATPase
VILSGFEGLDALAGGVEERRTYILHGNAGTGKTTFGLQFLYQGLIVGENAVLVSRRPAETVLEHARAFGMDIAPFARAGHLLIVEYVPRIIENVSQVNDPKEIFAEFERLLRGYHFQRLVFDPISPLLSGPAASLAIARARILLHLFAELQTTTFFVFDTPEGEEYLGNCKDSVYGVLQAEATAPFRGVHRLILERLPFVKGQRPSIHFEVRLGYGLVEASPRIAASPFQRSQRRS